MIATLALVISLLGVGGCFHHNQAYNSEALPPKVLPPLK
jgi:hypothetical protein